MFVYVRVSFVWMCVCMCVCMKVDTVHNFILVQLRYIIFTCILHTNVRQQLYVAKMYVGCIKRHTFYFLFYAILVCSVFFGVCLCYCNVYRNATA